MRFYRVAAYVAALVFFLLVRSGQPAPADTETFDSIVSAAETAYLENGTPGIMVVYVGKANGRVRTGFVPSGTSGAPGSAVPVDGSTVFEIGSITKTFTATLMEVALAHAGKAHRPDAAAGPLLAGYGITPSTTFDRITLEQLASHTAGLPKQGVSGPYSDALFADGKPDDPIKTFWSSWSATQGYAPGSCYAYSNSGFVTLGFAASQLMAPGISSQYDTLMSTNVTAPLAMHCTDPDLAHISCTPVAKGTLLKSDGKKVTVNTNAADMKSDAVDLQYWLDAQLGIDSGRGPIPAELNDAIAATHTVVNLPICGSTKPIDVALGWNVTYLDPRDHAAGMLYVKNGATSLGAMSAALAFSLDHHAGIAVLTNAVRFADEERLDGSPAPATPSDPQGLANELLRTWIRRGLN